MAQEFHIGDKAKALLPFPQEKSGYGFWKTVERGLFEVVEFISPDDPLAEEEYE